MRRDILLSGVIAVAVHALIFSVPLSTTMNNNSHAYIYEPISVRVICPRQTAAAMRPVQGSAQAPVKPGSEARSHVSGRRTVISKKKVGSKKHLTVKNMAIRQDSPEEAKKSEHAANPDNQHKLVKESYRDRMPKDRGKKIDNSPPVKIASRGQDNIVYARPKYKENPLPHYPKIARRRGYEGKTLLRVKVLENGKTGKIEVEESSGFKVLDTAALKSVSDWTFVPGKINGKKTEQWISVPIRFVLK
jgi:TonB family protein